MTSANLVSIVSGRKRSHVNVLAVLSSSSAYGLSSPLLCFISHFLFPGIFRPAGQIQTAC